MIKELVKELLKEELTGKAAATSVEGSQANPVNQPLPKGRGL
jgi:hypothetical protein